MPITDVPDPAAIALDELLDGQDPLRHLRHDSELDGIIDSKGLERASASSSELLTVLPQQSHSVQDGLLKLSFSHNWESPPSPISIFLAIDAAPGCGGLAWPAGQVHPDRLVKSFSVVESFPPIERRS